MTFEKRQEREASMSAYARREIKSTAEQFIVPREQFVPAFNPETQSVLGLFAAADTTSKRDIRASDAVAGRETLRKLKRGATILGISLIALSGLALGADIAFLGNHTLTLISSLFGPEGMTALSVYAGSVVVLTAAPLAGFAIWDKAVNDPKKVRLANAKARAEEAKEAQKKGR